ncbi:hypothetical protein VVD49_21410 [Uliginosibacterium sp. H3]|uniref:Uncharacterized protein n=1 Tax=Uliginosibacterium silvisoli TaxID=3114758 RepID=A0ABU6KBH3_9RHOO|nr:hypothetical protein [Uliginosibacterium sp. H3]
MWNRNQVTGHQPVEPDKGPVPIPKDEPAHASPPHRKHHDPEDPDFEETG